MASPACVPSSPCWALPLLDQLSDDQRSADPAMALKTERRLLALRHKMVSGEHKYNEGRVQPPHPSLGFEDDDRHRQQLQPRVLSSLPFAPLARGQLETTSLQTPRETFERNVPLKTPPTPGRKRRFLGGSTSKSSGCPSFLPLGSIAQEEQQKRPLSSVIPTRADSSLSADSEFRVDPRYDSPWLAGYAISAPPLASIEIKTDRRVAEQREPTEMHPNPNMSSPDPERAERDAFLLDKLRAVARMMDSKDAEALAAAAQPCSSSPGCSGIHRRISPNQRPNEGRIMRHMSMSHGSSSHSPHGSPPTSERLSRYAVRSLSLNMLQSNLTQSNLTQHSSDLKPGPPKSSFAEGKTLSPLARKLTKSMSLGMASNHKTAGPYKSSSGSFTVPIGNLPENQERVFRATTA